MRADGPTGRPTRTRRFVGVLFLALAALLLFVSAMATFGLTSEYGYSPNDDPAGDLLRAGLVHALAALLVTGLATGGLDLATTLPRHRRLSWAGVVFLVVFVVLGAALALGQRMLDARCAGPDRFSTGAC